jgi:hypothetical protein
VIDEFLINYGASQSKLDREFDRRIAPFRHIVRQLPDEWKNMLKGQYIAHRMFKKNGLIHRYLNHSGLKQLSVQEMEFLQSKSGHPWRYSFSEIIDEPAPGFFEMAGLFTDESYLLYSPSIRTILQNSDPLTWFSLIDFNGECYETYGPVVRFAGFEADDILFFARNAASEWLQSGREVAQAVEENPIPFCMLISGSTIPLVFKDNHQIVIANAEYEVFEPFHSERFRNDFLIEYSHGVYKLSSKEWGEFPHYSTAFYEENENLLTLYSMTDEGFEALVDALNSLGFALDYTPDERVNMGMKSTASDIFKEEFTLNRYNHLFSIDTPPEEQKGLDQMNELLAELIPIINSRQTPDLDALAAKFGVNPDEVKEIYNVVKKKVE